MSAGQNFGHGRSNRAGRGARTVPHANPSRIEATTMDYESFVTTVADLARTDRTGSERAIRATLQTLASM